MVLPAPPHAYGSDEAGLICAYLFDAQGLGSPVTPQQVRDLLPGAGAPRGFLWLHFSLSNTATRKWLQDHLRLPVEFDELLRDSPRSTRVELHDEELLAVIND